MKQIVNPFISIIMPVFNGEKTISNSIQSVLNQTYKNWELILIDDGSSDQTISIIQSYIHQDSRIIFLQNRQNLGVSYTRNKGIAKSSGNWIAFLDSDDQWHPDKLKKQVHVIQKNSDVDLVYTGSSFIHPSGKRSEYILQVPKTISYHTLLKQNIISCSSVLIRKKLAQRYPMKRDEMHEDYAVWLQILRDGYCAWGINEPLLRYQLSDHSKSSNKKKAAIMTYKVYRFMGLNELETFYYFSCYTWRNLKKYFHIHHAMGQKRNINIVDE